MPRYVPPIKPCARCHGIRPARLSRRLRIVAHRRPLSVPTCTDCLQTYCAQVAPGDAPLAQRQCLRKPRHRGFCCNDLHQTWRRGDAAVQLHREVTA